MAQQERGSCEFLRISQNFLKSCLAIFIINFKNIHALYYNFFFKNYSEEIFRNIDKDFY